MDEERKENKRPQRAAAARRKKRRRLNDLDSDSNLDEEESEDEFKISDGCVSRGQHANCCVLGEPHCCGVASSIWICRTFKINLRSLVLIHF